MILGFDVSHFQGAPNFAAAKAASRDFVVLKATEGIGYVDPSFAANRKAAHAAGMVVGIYHFARDNSPASESAFFSGAAGALQPGEFLVLDQEVTHAGGNVPWCAAWLDATRSHYGVAPFIYMNKGSSTGIASGNWTQVAQTYGLWAAIYDNSTTQPTVPYWGAPAMKQYSDAGTVLGVSGTCDVDVFYGSTAQLLAYCAPSGGTDVTPDELFNAPLFTDNPGTPQARVLRLRDFFTEIRNEQKAVFDAVFTGGTSMPDAGKSISQSLADVKSMLGGLTPAAIAAAIGQLPAAEAQQIADLVLAGIAAKMNTAP